MLNRSLSRILLACALVATLGSVALVAQTYPRIVVVEEWSSATCVPCVQATPWVNSNVVLDSGVVSIRYHMNFPAPNDPWNLYNPDEPNQRYFVYDNSGSISIPKATVNGGALVDPRPSSQGAIFAANIRNAPATSPILITVTQNGGKIKVVVKSSIALNAHKLQVALVSRFTNVPNIGSLMGGSPSNGETEFTDIFHKLLPDHNGTPLNIPAGGEQTFEFPASLINSDLIFPPGQQYGIAFVQANTSKEILQGGVSANLTATPATFNFFTRSKIETTAPNPYQKVARGGTSEIDVTVTNKGAAEATAQLSISNSAALTEVGMSATFTPSSVTLAPNESKNVKMRVTGSANRSPFIQVNPGMDASDGLAVAGAPVFYLVDGGKVVTYYGMSNSNWVMQAQAVVNSSFGPDVVYMPFSAELQSHYPVTDFDAAVFAFDAAWKSITGDVFTAMQSMEASGKGLWISGQANLYTTFDQTQNGGNALFQPVRDFFNNTLGIDFASTRQRIAQQGQQILIYPFGVKGVASDSIGSQIPAFNANQYSPTAWPYYVVFSDIIRMTPTSKAKSFMYYSDTVTNIGGVHVVTANGSRVAYTSLDFQAVAQSTTRDAISQAVLDWIMAVPAAAAPILTLTNSTLQYGGVVVNETKDMQLPIRNTGTGSLVITNMQVAGPDSEFFTITAGGTASGSVTIAPNTTHNVTVRFAPTAERNGYVGSINFTSNSAASPVAQLRGNGVVTSVETDVVSETGAIGLRLVGSNPVTDASAVELRSISNTTVTIVDATGRTVATIFEGATNGTQHIALQTSALPSGTYNVVATNGSESAVLSIVVTR